MAAGEQGRGSRAGEQGRARGARGLQHVREGDAPRLVGVRGRVRVRIMVRVRVKGGGEGYGYG